MNAMKWMLASTLTLAACGGATTDPASTSADVDHFQIVTPGKADDYYSNVATEFEVTGAVDVEMTDAEYADERLREQLVSERISAVGVYLTTYFSDKFHGIDINGDGEIGDDEVFFHNEQYGGFAAMVRNQSTEVVAVEGSAGTYTATFTIDVAGPRDLYDLLVADGATRQNGEGVSFGLRMPAGATTDAGGRPIRNFDPDTYQGALETVNLSMVALPDVGDAYPQYGAFFADNRLDITLYYGHDYTEGRNDLVDARSGFDTLLSLGFDAPVDSFEALAADSGPFTKHIVVYKKDSGSSCVEHELVNRFNDPHTDVVALQAIGVRSDAARNALSQRAGDDGVFGTADDVSFRTLQDIDDVRMIGARTMEKMAAAMGPICSTPARDATIEVRLFHSDMFVGARAAQREQALYELTHRDVFFYNGHAGPYYGLYLDGEYGAYVDDSDFANLAFDPDRQYLFIAQGCQTYSQYADMLYANPALSEANLDVITTVNYSYAQGTMNLFSRLVQTDDQGVHRPAPYNELIGGLNAESWNDQMKVFYGVMGIDQNPAAHPYALPDTIGNTCSTHEECGLTTDGGYCSGFADGINRCVTRVVAEDGCPAGTTYAYLADDQTVIGGVCWSLE